MRFRVSKAALMSGVAVAVLWTAEAWPQQRNFDVPSSDAVKAIPEFARQAGIQILAPADGLQGVRTPEVKGALELHAALSDLLAGTPVVVAADDGQTIVLSAARDNLSPQIQVAQAGPPAATQLAEAPSIEQVLVTGSLIRGANAVGAPVAKLDTTDFLQTGALTTTDVLKSIPAVSLIPSASPQATFSNLGKVNPINIHGVGSLETLLLVDGIRTPLQGKNRYNDPSIVPSIAVDHVDVLADGASATYGSDAVAGVVNVILKRNFDGAISQGHVAFGDDFFQWQASQLFGRTWDGGDVAVSFDYYDEGTLHAKDRASLYTYDLSTVGYLNRTPAGASFPGTLSNGNAKFNNGVGGACANCFAAPLGLTPTSVVNFATLTPGANNEHNIYQFADILPHDKRASTTLTFDQSITPDVQFFAEGYYSNRRSHESYAPSFPPGTNNAANNLTLPANYPYLTGAPSGLKVSYNFSPILTPFITGAEVADRYAGGFNAKLPFDWSAKLLYATSEDRMTVNQENQVNLNNVNVLLGNTLAPVAVPGSPTQTVSITRPSSLPIFNVLCDPTAFTCLNADQIAFIQAYSHELSDYLRHEANVTLDGPLFAVPGGEVRLAVGGDYYKDTYSQANESTATGPSAQTPVPASAALGTAASLSREVYAFFGELNVPLIGSDNALLLVQRFDVEISGRYDHYSDFGSTSNPRIGVDWGVIDGLTLRGSWGTSFRAPTLVDTSNVGRTISGVNAQIAGQTNGTPNCPTGATQPVPGSSGAAILAAIGGTCASNPFSGGLNDKGGGGGLAGLLRPIGSALGPETAKTWTVGANFAPTQIPGLTLDVTYYNLSISKVLGAVANTNRLTDPSLAFSNLVTGQPGFASAVTALLNSGSSLVSPSFANQVLFIADNSTNNLGSFMQEGLDFRANYVIPYDEYGTWNIGVVGSYIFHQLYSPAPGATATDISNTLTSGPENIGALRLRVRGNLGWTSESGLSVNLFANYQNAYKNTQAIVFPASGIVPSFTTFDLAVGYDLGDQPANDYLKKINFELVVNNLFAPRLPVVVYTQGGGGTTAFDGVNFSPLGRIISFTITKTW